MKTSLFSIRRALLSGAFVLAGISLLQGCFPLVAVGIGAGAIMIADRRSTGAYVDDEAIEWKAADVLRKNFGTLNHTNATSYNRNVLLSGEVQNENIRAEAQRLVGGIAGVRSVVNELVVGPASRLPDRSNDALITSNVKTRFLNNGQFTFNHIKVVTEAGTVFLLGLVTRAESEQAAEIARTSRGVKKVVKVFEYIGDGEAQKIDSGNTATRSAPVTETPLPSTGPSFPPEAP
ncbi:MAG: BON domain-containing protein [Azoarcus sp.]|jgi:osmotically-inducible protein OsmY|nr:BON domain-containing protein [Azoarcus sp.]